MNNKNWEEVYKFAVQEVDGRKMPERICAARDAIGGRLREMEGDSDHHEERGRLEHAMNALKVLATESQAWHRFCSGGRRQKCLSHRFQHIVAESILFGKDVLDADPQA